MAAATIGVHSGKVMTVLGPVPVEAIGVTLMHEHIVLDTSSWWRRPCCATDIGLATHQSAHGTQHRHGRGLLSGAVASRLRQRYVCRWCRGVDRLRLRRLG